VCGFAENKGCEAMTEAIIGLVGLLLGGAVGFFFERLRRGTAYQDRDAI